ncbi:MAG: hypothetical protein DHS20C05_18920 [Hyphococcus sp.]|nr:MAG: hypothetical protein DHS20C05_18920 [Marinicaulis sp.]
MPKQSTDNDKPQDGREGAVKKPMPEDTGSDGAKDGNKAGKAKSSDREARLAEALRQNLRRRKAPPEVSQDKKED